MNVLIVEDEMMAQANLARPPPWLLGTADQQ